MIGKEIKNTEPTVKNITTQNAFPTIPRITSSFIKIEKYYAYM